jgi:phosphatidylserine decarboxylase
MRKKLFIFLQHVLPQHLISRFMGAAANCRWLWLKNYMISRFIRRYQVDLSLSLSERLETFPTFNSFFTRALKKEVRPIAVAPDIVVSPIDGGISQLGSLDASSLLQAKGSYFSVDTLLGKQKSGAEAFYNGHYATFYLSPKDYHRVHMPLAGKLLQTIYIPGKLFSVNPIATEMIPQLFSRNERLVCLFDTVCGRMAVIFIGAMLVGKIETIWGLIERSSAIVCRHYSDQEALYLAKGAELGRFNMGSSVILLFEKDQLQWLAGLTEKSAVQMGQGIGRLVTLSRS